MDVTIHDLTKDYYSPLEEIHVQVVGNFDSPIDLNNFRRYVRFRSRLIKIAVCCSKIIGYIIGDQNSSSKARIFSLYVLPDFQRRQIGSDLLRTLEREFLIKQPNLRYLSVRIPETFFASKHFFLKQGFDVIATINCYAKDNLSFPYHTEPRLEIRSATTSDLENLVKLENTCFSEYWRKNREDFKKEIEMKTNSLFVAFLEGKLVGYNSNSVSANRIEGHYARIATHPEFRKQRIATSLTAEAFHWFRKQQVQRILLTTFAESDFHNRMYVTWGFKFLEQEMIMAKQYS